MISFCRSTLLNRKPILARYSSCWGMPKLPAMKYSFSLCTSGSSPEIHAMIYHQFQVYHMQWVGVSILPGESHSYGRDSSRPRRPLQKAWRGVIHHARTNDPIALSFHPEGQRSWVGRCESSTCSSN